MQMQGPKVPFKGRGSKHFQQAIDEVAVLVRSQIPR